MLDASKILFTFLVFISAYRPYAEGQCGQCSTVSGVACLTANTFAPCQNGAISSTILTCPNEMICTDTIAICAATTTPSKSAVCQCGLCNTAQTYACINSTTYAYCFGQPTPFLSDTMNCPSGQYCSIASLDSNSICTANANISTCSISTTTTTTTAPTTIAPTTIPSSLTTSPPTSASTPSAMAPPSSPTTNICQSVTQSGSYPNPTSTDCTSFIYCFLYAGSIRSQIYTCANGNVFNPEMKLCVLPTLYTCPGAK